MFNRLTPYHAQMIAQNVDYNYNGVIERRELKFRHDSRRLADFNRDGVITTQELAHSLMRGDIFISHDRRAYPTYQAPYPVSPGYPYGQPYPYPGYGYGHNSMGNTLGATVVGAALGAGVGAVVDGSSGAGTGAVIGGALGFIGSLFDN